MAKIKFERTTAPICSVEFSRNPSVRDGNDEEVIGYLQPKDRADGGDWYISDKGINPENYRYLDFKNNPETDWVNFKAFLAAVVGSLYNFIFTDSDGNTHTARLFNTENLRGPKAGTGRRAFSLELLIESGNIEEGTDMARNPKTLMAAEDLTAGDWINIYNDSGTAKMRKTNATDDTKPAHGYVLSAVSSGLLGTAYLSGINNQRVGLTPGSVYYLDISDGAEALTAPSALGNILQILGLALSTTDIDFKPSQPITLG